MGKNDYYMKIGGINVNGLFESTLDVCFEYLRFHLPLSLSVNGQLQGFC